MLTPREQDILIEYICRVANDLGLKHWRFAIGDEPPDTADAWASVTPTYGKQYATLNFCEDFRDLAEDIQRNVVVHELLHCHFESAFQVTQIGLGEISKGKAASMLVEMVRNALEYQTDLMASGLERFFETIDWTDGEELRGAVDQPQHEEQAATEAAGAGPLHQGPSPDAGGGGEGDQEDLPQA